MTEGLPLALPTNVSGKSAVLVQAAGGTDASPGEQSQRATKPPGIVPPPPAEMPLQRRVPQLSGTVPQSLAGMHCWQKMLQPNHALPLRVLPPHVLPDCQKSLRPPVFYSSMLHCVGRNLCDLSQPL